MSLLTAFAVALPGMAADCRRRDFQINQMARCPVNHVSLTFLELALIAVTRAVAGAGLALLLADRLNREVRRAVGWTVLAVGVLNTVPLIAEVFGKGQATPNSDNT